MQSGGLPMKRSRAGRGMFMTCAGKGDSVLQIPDDCGGGRMRSQRVDVSPLKSKMRSRNEAKAR